MSLHMGKNGTYVKCEARSVLTCPLGGVHVDDAQTAKYIEEVRNEIESIVEKDEYDPFTAYLLVAEKEMDKTDDFNGMFEDTYMAVPGSLDNKEDVVRALLAYSVRGSTNSGSFIALSPMAETMFNDFFDKDGKKEDGITLDGEISLLTKKISLGRGVGHNGESFILIKRREGLESVYSDNGVSVTFSKDIVDEEVRRLEDRLDVEESNEAMYTEFFTDMYSLEELEKIENLTRLYSSEDVAKFIHGEFFKTQKEYQDAVARGEDESKLSFLRGKMRAYETFADDKRGKPWFANDKNPWVVKRLSQRAVDEITATILRERTMGCHPDISLGRSEEAYSVSRRFDEMPFNTYRSVLVSQYRRLGNIVSDPYYWKTNPKVAMMAIGRMQTLRYFIYDPDKKNAFAPTYQDVYERFGYFNKVYSPSDSDNVSPELNKWLE